MTINACTGSINSVCFTSAGFQSAPGLKDSQSVTCRQEAIPGFSQEALRYATVAMLGCGGVGGAILENLARKGVGSIEVCDGDDVELSNLNRQKFFRDDVGKNKALCLARHAIKHATWPMSIEAYTHWFEDAIDRGFARAPSVVIVGVDRNSTRLASARHFYRTCPVIFTAVDEHASHGYVFVQKPGGPCFGCLFPDAIGNKHTPCTASPAMVDILLLVGALVLAAVDSVHMKGRPIHWNYRTIHLSGAIHMPPAVINRRPNCPLCSNL